MLNNPIVKETGKLVGSILVGQLIVFTTFVTIGVAEKTVRKLTKEKSDKIEEVEVKRVPVQVKNERMKNFGNNQNGEA